VSPVLFRIALSRSGEAGRRGRAAEPAQTRQPPLLPDAAPS
jgi:hypothetical protein